MNVAEEYYWAITQVVGLSCYGLSVFCLLKSGFQLDCLLCTCIRIWLHTYRVKCNLCAIWPHTSTVKCNLCEIRQRNAGRVCKHTKDEAWMPATSIWDSFTLLTDGDEILLYTQICAERRRKTSVKARKHLYHARLTSKALTLTA
jgi:hypothetical protein